MVSVDGGLAICWIVWAGTTTLSTNSFKRAGRHSLSACDWSTRVSAGCSWSAGTAVAPVVAPVAGGAAVVVGGAGVVGGPAVVGGSAVVDEVVVDELAALLRFPLSWMRPRSRR